VNYVSIRTRIVFVLRRFEEENRIVVLGSHPFLLARIFDQAGALSVRPLDIAIGLEPTPVLLHAVGSLDELEHILIRHPEALLFFAFFAIVEAQPLLPPLVPLLIDSDPLDYLLIGVVSPESHGFLVGPVLEGDLALGAGIASGLGVVSVGPPDVAIGLQTALDVGVLVVNEPVSVPVVALTARFLSVRAVLVTVLLVELKLIHRLLVRIPRIPRPVRHLVDVFERCVARFYTASVPEACRVAITPLDVAIGQLDGRRFRFIMEQLVADFFDAVIAGTGPVRAPFVFANARDEHDIGDVVRISASFE